MLGIWPRALLPMLIPTGRVAQDMGPQNGTLTSNPISGPTQSIDAHSSWFDVEDGC